MRSLTERPSGRSRKPPTATRRRSSATAAGDVSGYDGDRLGTEIGERNTRSYECSIRTDPHVDRSIDAIDGYGKAQETAEHVGHPATYIDLFGSQFGAVEREVNK